jgi:hypothetical protein
MKLLRKYFRSLETFVKLLFILRIRFNLLFYKYLTAIVYEKIRNRFNKNSFHSLDSLISSKLIDVQGLRFDAISVEEKNAILDAAEKIMNGLHDLLGSGETLLNPIDWHTDFKTGYRWPPGKFYLDYAQESIATSSDVKVPRELSRCHHLLKLAMAYQLTGNSIYAEKILEQINDWIDNNPLMFSINWGCTMDVAIRAVNWVWSLGMIAGYPVERNLLQKISLSLYEHGWFIYRNPEKRALNNHNHYLADLAGQINLGLIFYGQCSEAEKWLKSGIQELFIEMRLQILPTGMSYERSTNYNRLVLELLLIPILVLKRNGYEIPADIWHRLEKMFEFIMYSLKPDGTTPVIGDQDNGRLLPFGSEELIDFRYLLSLGAILFRRQDFKSKSNGFNAYCVILGGISSKQVFDSLKSLTDVWPESKGFPDAGFYFMRKNDNYLSFNLSGKGLYPDLEIGGTHTHSDLLSVELFTNGKSFLIDPGSYVYTANAEERMLFRSTAMHNTATVDGFSQNAIKKESLWNFERNAIPELIHWECLPDRDTIFGKHNGYLRLNDGVLHSRKIVFDKNIITWEFTDIFEGSGEHTINIYFHFDADIDFKIANNQLLTICSDQKNLSIEIDTKDQFTFKKEMSWVSKSYGSKVPARVLNVEFRTRLPYQFKYLIKPVI